MARGNTCLLVCYKPYYKGHRWTVKWKATWGKVYMGRSTELPSLPAYTTLAVPSCVQQPGTALNPIVQGFLWRLHDVGMIYYLTQSPAFLPFLEVKRWGWKSRTFSPGLGLSGNQLPSRNLPRVTSLKHKKSLLPRKFQRF